MLVGNGVVFHRGFSNRSIQSRYSIVLAAAAALRKQRRPTRLELEALALEKESPRRQSRLRHVNALQSLLESSGVPPGYAFDILEHSSDLVDNLREQAEDKDSALLDLQSLHIDDSSSKAKSYAAKAKNFSAMVCFLHKLRLPASDVPKLVSRIGLESGIETIAAMVEFLKGIGISLPKLLAAHPELLHRDLDEVSLTIEFLIGLGFTSKSIASLVSRSPILLSRTAEDLARRVEYMIDLVGFSARDVRRLVNRYPWVLVDENKLDDLVAYLQEIGVRKNSLGRVIAGKLSLLETEVSDLARSVAFLKSIHASDDDIDKILFLYPGLLGYNPEVLRPMVTYLESLGVPPSLMGKLLRRHPRLLTNRLHIQERVEFLLSSGLQQKDLGKVLFRAPQLLSLDVDANMIPTMNFLASIGVDLLRVLKSKPMILGYSVEAKIRPNLEFIQNLGLDPDSIGKLLTRCPHLLTLSVENNLRPTLCYFLELGFQRKEVAEMVRRLPSLLGFSVSALLAPKYEFFRGVMHRPRRELVQFPQYFSYSLDRRLRPRFERLGDGFQGHGLGVVYSCSDAVFEKRCARWTTGSGGRSARTQPVQVGGESNPRATRLDPKSRLTLTV